MGKLIRLFSNFSLDDVDEGKEVYSVYKFFMCTFVCASERVSECIKNCARYIDGKVVVL